MEDRNDISYWDTYNRTPFYNGFNIIRSKDNHDEIAIQKGDKIFIPPIPVTEISFDEKSNLISLSTDDYSSSGNRFFIDVYGNSLNVNGERIEEVYRVGDFGYILQYSNRTCTIFNYFSRTVYQINGFLIEKTIDEESGIFIVKKEEYGQDTLIYNMYGKEFSKDQYQVRVYNDAKGIIQYIKDTKYVILHVRKKSSNDKWFSELDKIDVLFDVVTGERLFEAPTIFFLKDNTSIQGFSLDNNERLFLFDDNLNFKDTELNFDAVEQISDFLFLGTKLFDYGEAKYYIIDKNLQVKIEAPYENPPIVSRVGNFIAMNIDSEDLIIDSKTGYILHEGIQLCGEENNYQLSEEENNYPISVYKVEDIDLYRYGYIDNNGRIIVPCKYSNLYVFSKNRNSEHPRGYDRESYLAKFEDSTDNSVGYVNHHGIEIIRLQDVSDIRVDTKSRYYPFCKNGKWGYAGDGNNNILIPPIYNWVGFFDNGFAKVIKEHIPKLSLSEIYEQGTAYERYVNNHFVIDKKNKIDYDRTEQYRREIEEDIEYEAKKMEEEL